jgi:hypothetical protein
MSIHHSTIHSITSQKSQKNRIDRIPQDNIFCAKICHKSNATPALGSMQPVEKIAIRDRLFQS